MPYITRLAETILEEDLDHPAYVTSREGQSVYDGCRDIFSFGLSYFDWLKRPLMEEGEELEQVRCTNCRKEYEIRIVSRKKGGQTRFYVIPHVCKETV